MAWMEVLAPAKVNLFLELIDRRTDGFHELETVMVSVNLFDRILLRRRRDEQIKLSQLTPGPVRPGSTNTMPQDRTNLVWRAIDLLREQTGNSCGLDVAVQKRIPAQSGMGGASSDAAATLCGVNQLLDLKLNNDVLKSLAGQLGSDVAFFVDDVAARCTGRGEIVQAVDQGHPLSLVIAMPPAGLSTAAVFGQCEVPNQPKSSADLLAALVKGNIQKVGSRLCNRLQFAARQLSPWLRKLEDEFQRTGSAGHQMTGSGSAWFGIYANRAVAMRAMRKLSSRLPTCEFYCVHTLRQPSGRIRYLAE